MTRVYTFALALLCVALPEIGSAAELQLRTFSTMNFSSNDMDSSSDSTGEKRAFFIMSAPVEIITRPSRRSKATFRYTPRFELKPTEGWLSAWNHSVDAEGKYEFSRRLRGSASLSYADVGFIRPDEEANDDSTLNRSGAFTRTGLTSQLIYSLTNRLSFSGFFAYQRAAFDAVSRNDSQTVSGGLNLDYSLSQRDSVGLGIQPSYSIFDESLRSQGQKVTNLGINLRWSHSFSKAWKIRIAGGPTVSFFESVPFPSQSVLRFPLGLPDDNDVQPFLKVNDNCQPDLPFGEGCTNADVADVDEDDDDGEPNETFGSLGLTADEARFDRKTVPVPSLESSETQVNYFGTIALSYQRARWNFETSFRRTQSTDSGFGASSAVNSLTFKLDWEATSRWTVRFVGNLSERSSLTESSRPTDDFFIESIADSAIRDLDGDAVAERKELETEVISQPVMRKEAYARIDFSRRMTSRLTLRAGVYYSYQDRRSVFNDSVGGLWRVDCGFQYYFRPVRF